MAADQGIEHAWGLLSACDPAEVVRRAAVRYTPGTGEYTVPVLGHEVAVDVPGRIMRGSGRAAEFILAKTAYFSRLSILHYLLNAQELAPAGRLLKPEELKSGQMYRGGSHILPLDALAVRFSESLDDFRAKAAAFGGAPRDYGDASAEFHPFPRVPITLILWQGDDEFPARGSLLFDETCELHLPPDILWSIAMLCLMVMLRYEPDAAGGS